MNEISEADWSRMPWPARRRRNQMCRDRKAHAGITRLHKAAKKEVSVAEIRKLAAGLLAALPADPLAEMHRVTLARELYARTQPTKGG